MSPIICKAEFEYLQLISYQLFLNAVGVWFVYFLNEV